LLALGISMTFLEQVVLSVLLCRLGLERPAQIHESQAIMTLLLGRGIRGIRPEFERLKGVYLLSMPAVADLTQFRRLRKQSTCLFPLCLLGEERKTVRL
jgi:hypothetical protein